MAFRLPLPPLALRVPLLTAATVFLFTVTTGQLVSWAMGQRLDQEAERLGRVYLDGLAAAVLPAVRNGDAEALQEALQRALGFQEGIRERRIAIGSADGQRLASAGIGPNPEWPAPFARGLRGHIWELATDGDAVWAQRPLKDRGQVIGVVAAKLDVSSIMERRRRLDLAMLSFGLAIALIGAAFSALAARHALKPVLAITQALRRVGDGQLEPLAEPMMPPSDSEAGRLGHAFNGMVAQLTRRENLSRRLAERERAALLGRLVGTVAHEVRNPLAGMLTAVETARQFGHDEQERNEALDVLERGLRQIERVVASTLAVHRDWGPPRSLAAADFEDLRVLVTPAAQRRGIALDWCVALPEPFPVDALRLRQMVLNLLLNAVAATPAGGRVRLEVKVGTDARLAVVVEDSGAGLSPAAERRLCSPASPAEDDAAPVLGLGLEVVAALGQQLAVEIAVQPGAGGRGTRIILQAAAASSQNEPMPPELLA